MTKLEDITANRTARRDLVRRVAELDAELEGPDGLVSGAFAEGATGPEIAAAAGVSKPRVYQIRDGRR